MAEQDSTFLDKVIGVGTPSAALIYGLTRARQDEAIRDQIREKIAEPYFYAQDPSIPRNERLLRAMKLKDRTEDLVQRLPESWQDSWLRSLGDAYDAKFFSPESHPGYGGFYRPLTGSINFPRDYVSPSTVIHEVGHKTDHDINLSKAENELKDMENVEDVMTGANLGREVKDDVLDAIVPPHGDYGGVGRPGKEWLSLPYEEKLKQKKKILEESVRPFAGDNPSASWINDLADMKAMDPDFNIDFDYTKAHNRSYVNGKFFDAKKNGVPDDAAWNSALSKESSQILKERAVDDNDGVDYVRNTFPRAFSMMDSVYRNDPRIERELRHGNLGDLSKYEYTYYGGGDGFVSSSNGEPALYNPDRYKFVTDMYGEWKPRDGYFRVRSPYGGYNYIPASDVWKEKDADKVARRLGADYYQMKDLDGDWVDVRPVSLKNNDMSVDVPSFDQRYKFYADTPYGRKGFRYGSEAAAYMRANPEINKLYEGFYVPGADGNYPTYTDKFGEERTRRKWKLINPKPLDELFFGNDSPISDYEAKMVDKYRKDYELMKRIRADKIKARNALNAIRRVR